MQTCSESIYSSREDHRCGRNATHALVFPASVILACDTHTLSRLAVTRMPVVVMSLPAYNALGRPEMHVVVSQVH
jgi:hypothetical protein